MKTVGLTGGIASGKSTVGAFLRKRGIRVVSADDFARQAVELGGGAYAGVIEVFGKQILEPDGRINRKILANIVFNDQGLRRQLEALIHPVVIDAIQQEMEAARVSGAFLFVAEVPLLFEVGLERMFDQVWVVNVTLENQIKRMTNRDRFTLEEAERRLAAQIPLSVKAEKADVVIDNNGEIVSLETQVDRLLKSME